MGIQRITVKTCDRCDERIEGAGELIVAYRGCESSITAQGDRAGRNITADAILCHKCIPGFLAYMRPASEERTGPKETPDVHG